MSSAAVGSNSGGAGPLSLMSCVRESSPLQDYDQEHEKHVASKRRFWNPKKWFKRKNKAPEDVIPTEVPQEVGKDALRSRSTSELSVDEDQTRRRSSSTMHPGLSVSHDSVFHPLNSGSDDELDAAQSSSSLSISQPLGDPKLQTELSERLRLRRRRDAGDGGGGGQSEDDEGLPRSPCNSPTAGDHGFLAMLDKTACKDLPTKSHSTCSDGSLLSMGSSSDMDEDSIGPQSRHSSKLSLHDKRTDSEHDWEVGPTVPLNHSAAHHKVAVRPKKTYGAPRRRKGQQLSSVLPATPEVNEDSSIRSASPESATKEAITELYSVSMSTSKGVLTEKQLKCSSLPPGLAPPTQSKLSRSKSNAGTKSVEGLLPLAEKEEKPSLFERIFPRKSGKKKKKEEKDVVKEEIIVTHEQQEKKETKNHLYNIEKTCSESVSHSTVSKREEHKPLIAPRTGAAYRQRIQPMDIPATPKEVRESSSPPSILMSPDKSFSGTSPIQAELEQVFKQKQIPVTSSRSEAPWKDTPPQSPKSPRSLVMPVITSKSDTTHGKSTSHTSIFSEARYEVKNEDIRHKIKIAGLSPLQQRVLSLNDEEDEESGGYKSLTDFSVKKNKPLMKSHSFKSSKRQPEDECDKSKGKIEEKRTSVIKASSLDSFKNLDEPPPQKETKSIVSSNTEAVTSQKYFKQSDSDQAKKVFDENFGTNDSITISGPSHTAVVNVRTNTEDYCSKSSIENEINEKDGLRTYTHKENQISVTKIQLKHETTQVTKSTVTVPKNELPEFLNKQLNKVEVRPASNIVFSMKPKVAAEEQSRPKTLFNFDVDQENVKQPGQKLSKENIENIDKEDQNCSTSSSPKTPPIPISSQRFKKNEKSSSRKSSVISVTTPDSPNSKEKPLLKNKSMSLDSLKSDHNSEILSSQDSLDKLEGKSEKKNSDGVVLRRKSVPKQKNEDEPELMKVFARRSLKLKESDIEQIQEQLQDPKSKDSDKENSDCLSDTVVEMRPKETKAKETVETKLKEPLTESKKTDVAKNILKDESDIHIKKATYEQKKMEFLKSNSKEEPEVQLRRPLNNNFFGQRAISLNPANTNTSELVVKKQSSFTERRRTDQWITNVKNDLEKDRMSEEILTTISSKSDLIEDEFKTETKNFRQRKAEWEKRAQLAQKKTVP